MSSTDDLLAELDQESAEEQSTASQTDRRESHGLRARVGSRLRSGNRPSLGARLGRLFSPRAFLAALGLSIAGTAIAGFIPLFGGLAPLLGVFLAGFLLGLGRKQRSYLEVALAGAGMAAVAALTLPLLVVALSGFGVHIAAITGGAGLAAGIVGHYFGRDLRDGVTRDL